MLYLVGLPYKCIAVCCLLSVVWCDSVNNKVQTVGIALYTKLGDIAGTSTVVEGTSVASFLGIPYAKPPIGELRFKKPQPFGKLGSRDAIKFGSACPQVENGIYTGSEDCLTLNVFTSAYRDGDPKPVAIYIYGGGYNSGKSEFYPGEVLAATQDIVVVTINYRINALGFLSTGDERLPGNLGLWDQHLAIKWVKDNIDDYGGDANSVTIVGESAGGSSVLYQALSPQNDLSRFQKVIANSPYITYMAVVNRNLAAVADSFFELVDCGNATDLVVCLREKSARELVEASSTIKDVNAFFPVADGDFLPKDLGHLFDDFTKYGNNTANLISSVGNFADYEIFSGFNSQEGLLFMGNLLAINQAFTKRSNLDEGVSEMVVKAAMQYYPLEFLEPGGLALNITTDLLLNYYMRDVTPGAGDGRSIEDRRVEAYMKISSDLTLKLPVIQLLELHSILSKKSSYMYEFDHKRSFATLFYEGPTWLRTGANHGDDIVFVFGMPFLAVNPFGFIFTKEEETLSRNMMSYWANFVKTGNPGDDFSKFTYPHSQKYTRFGANGSEQLSYPLSHEERLWSALQLAVSGSHK